MWYMVALWRGRDVGHPRRGGKYKCHVLASATCNVMCLDIYIYIYI